MRFHTDKVTSNDMYAATDAAGMHGVYFVKLDEKGSRTRKRAWDFRLMGSVSNRPLNFAPEGYEHETAATWDEWGIFLNHLFRIDPLAHTGPTGYKGLKDFQAATGNRFDTLQHADQHPNHRWMSVAPYISQCRHCLATLSWGPGRSRILLAQGRLVNLDSRRSINSWLASA